MKYHYIYSYKKIILLYFYTKQISHCYENLQITGHSPPNQTNGGIGHQVHPELKPQYTNGASRRISIDSIESYKVPKNWILAY